MGTARAGPDGGPRGAEAGRRGTCMQLGGGEVVQATRHHCDQVMQGHPGRRNGRHARATCTQTHRHTETRSVRFKEVRGPG